MMLPSTVAMVCVNCNSQLTLSSHGCNELRLVIRMLSRSVLSAVFDRVIQQALGT